ncbi:hypothetical protein [Ralstonia phage RP31]|uniref:Uncharacterized protein n=1 Tax=Ralstonia phage RP31 TaxID=1923890 RepID=A0A1L7N1C1_9CAUD|nr:hypothetical protein [Ralstonia phage RP31]
MTENDTLHLWFKPYGGVMGDSDVAFVERYGRRFYPKAMGELAKQLHKLCAKITRMCPAGMFEYQMMHWTKKANSRYVIQESLRDKEDLQGLSIAIQPTTADERKLFTQSYQDGEGNRGTPVQNVVLYLEDSLENEGHKWENAKMKNGQEALPVLLEIIAFLKTVKNTCCVDTCEVTHSEQGIIITLALVSPGVLSYYTRIDWVIV